MKLKYGMLIVLAFILAAFQNTAQAQVCRPSSTTLCDGPAELPLTFTSQPPFPDPCPYTQGETGSDACGFAITQITSQQGAVALQNAIDSPTCGTGGAIIALQSGAKFSQDATNDVTLRYQAGSCAGKWIIIRSDVSDSKMPPYDQPGQRALPSDASLFATLQAEAISSAVVATAPVTPGSGQGPNHYWLMGLNITGTAGTTADPGLVQIGNGETQVRDLPNNITIDRCYIHGPNGTTNIHRDVDAEGTYIAVLNSWLTVVNDSIDQQTVLFYNTPGPILIDNNHLEGGAEQILSGGAHPSITGGVITADVTITRNHMYRNTAYYPGASNYNGFPLIVKNDIEFKEIERALVQGNVMDYVWAGYSQNGDALAIGPMSQTGLDSYLMANDITFRYNLIRHANAAIGLGVNTPGYGNGAPTHGMARVSVHDNVFSDINTKWGVILTNGKKVIDRYFGITIVSSLDPIAKSPTYVDMQHNDFLTGSMQATAYWDTPGRFVGSGYIFANNILSQTGASYGWTSGGFGDDTCSAIYVVDPGAQVENNMFVGVPRAQQAGYTSNCIIAPPMSPVLTTSATGGSIPANTTVYVRTTLVTPTGETTASLEQPVTKPWLALSSYNSGTTILDGNQGTELAYIDTESGLNQPSWAANIPANLDGWTIEALSGISKCNSPLQLYPPIPICMGWILIANGASGTIRTGAATQTNMITITPPPPDDGPETQYRAYAGSSSGREAYCGTYGITQAATITSLANCRGTAPPSVNTATVAPPTFVCNTWPQTYSAVGFVNYSGGNYQLTSSSCGHAAAMNLYPGWTARTLQSEYDTIKDSNGNYEMALNAGATGSSEPAWPTVPGGEVQDGSMTWQMSTSRDVGANVTVVDAATANVGSN
ncbi:MAG: hypothetical protein ACRD3T_06690 [Terriglobia bacterium]